MSHHAVPIKSTAKLCISNPLVLNLDFSLCGKAAKELLVLYTKIAGSYFNLWELDGFPETKCFIELSVIKSFSAAILQITILGNFFMFGLNQRSKVSLPQWQREITNYSSDMWQPVECVRIYLSLRRLIPSSVWQIKLMTFLQRFHSTAGQQERAYVWYLWVLIRKCFF